MALLCHTAGFYPMHRTIINEIAQKAGLDENETGDFAFCEKIALEGTKAVAELLDAQTKENRRSDRRSGKLHELLQ